MGSSTNVSAAKPNLTGCIYIGTSTATAPTGTDSSLTAYTNLGYISEDGVENDYSRSSNDIKEWGGAIVASFFDEQKDEWKFTLIESLNVDVLKSIYGADNVTVDASTKKITISAKAEELTSAKFIIDMVLADQTAKRIYIPIGKITDLGTINYKRTDVVGYGITIKGYPDSDGVTHKEFITKK